MRTALQWQRNYLKSSSHGLDCPSVSHLSDVRIGGVGTQHLFHCPYHPQSTGDVKRQNSLLKKKVALGLMFCL